MLEGDLMELYKSFIIGIHVDTNGEDNLVTWTVDYEKLHEGIPAPTTLMDFFVEVTKDIETHHLQHNISGGGISSYGFGTAYGGSAQDYASSGGSNNTIAARGGYYRSGRGTYHDGSSSSNDYRGFGYYHHDGQPNFSDYGSSSHSSHSYGSSSHSSHPYPTTSSKAEDSFFLQIHENEPSNHIASFLKNLSKETENPVVLPGEPTVEILLSTFENIYSAHDVPPEQ
ncbi:hypothetical protein LguiB_015015 [Lonicera macranthoides]